jgi:hypothetical protein
MRERGVVRSIGESIDAGRLFGGVALGLVAGVLLALAWIFLRWDARSAGELWWTWGLCYAGAMAAAALLAWRLRINAWLATGVMVVAWPPLSMLVYVVVFFLTWDPQ